MNCRSNIGPSLNINGHLPFLEINAGYCKTRHATADVALISCRPHPAENAVLVARQTVFILSLEKATKPTSDPSLILKLKSLRPGASIGIAAGIGVVKKGTAKADSIIFRQRLRFSGTGLISRARACAMWEYFEPALN